MSVTEHMQEPVFGRRARWCIDPDRLEIRFSVGLMKVANVEGRFGELEGAVVLDDGAPHWSRVDLFIEAASINTRNPVRDFHLRTKDYLDAKQFPCITFKSTHVVPLDDKTYRVTGDLTIRGVTREISLDVAHDGEIDELGARRRRFSAETRIYRKDFGIDPGVAGLGFLIGNEVTVRVRGEAVEQPRCGTDLLEKSYEAN
jgi:polyisoprenoid-binding protein YceI